MFLRTGQRVGVLHWLLNSENSLTRRGKAPAKKRCQQPMLGSFVRLLQIEPERLTFARWDATPDRINRCHHSALTPKQAVG
jgi:hypothetical protein